MDETVFFENDTPFLEKNCFWGLYMNPKTGVQYRHEMRVYEPFDLEKEEPTRAWYVAEYRKWLERLVNEYNDAHPEDQIEIKAT